MLEGLVALAAPPALTWAVSGGGTVSAAGLFTAGTTVGGPFTLTASSGGKSGMSADRKAAALGGRRERKEGVRGSPKPLILSP